MSSYFMRYYVSLSAPDDVLLNFSSQPNSAARVTAGYEDSLGG